jgi:hypothetical protein
VLNAIIDYMMTIYNRSIFNVENPIFNVENPIFNVENPIFNVENPILSGRQPRCRAILKSLMYLNVLNVFECIYIREGKKFRQSRNFWVDKRPRGKLPRTPTSGSKLPETSQE